MTLRTDNQPENNLITSVSHIDSDLRELKTGIQFTEAKFYEYSSSNSYDFTGSMPTSTVANQVVVQVVVTATSADSSPFISTFFPEIWIPDMATPYHDKITNTYGINFNRIVTDDTTKTQYWVGITCRPSGTAASTFYMKTHIYATVPVTVTYARTI